MGPASTLTLTLPKRKPKTTTPVVPAMTPTPPKRKPTTTRHHFPVASNGKLLDVAIISEQKPQSTKVNLHWWVYGLNQIQTLKLRTKPLQQPHVKENLVKGTDPSNYVRSGSVHFNMRTYLIHYWIKHVEYSVWCVTL